MSAWETFAWGLLGSAAVEMVTLLGYYSAGATRLPLRYRRVGFWIARSILSVLAGLLAVAYEIDQPILAFNVGAATPLIVTFMARGVRRVYAPSTLDTLPENAPREPASEPRPGRKLQPTRERAPRNSLGRRS